MRRCLYWKRTKKTFQNTLFSISSWLTIAYWTAIGHQNNWEWSIFLTNRPKGSSKSAPDIFRPLRLDFIIFVHHPRLNFNPSTAQLIAVCWDIKMLNKGLSSQILITKRAASRSLKKIWTQLGNIKYRGFDKNVKDLGRSRHMGMKKRW